MEKGDFLIGEWIDVMPLIDVDSHAVEGVWNRTGDAIEVDPHYHARILIPVVLQGDFEVEFEFEFEFDNATPRRETALVFPLAGRSCALIVDGWPDDGGFCYLDYVNNMRAKDNPSAIHGFLHQDQQRVKYRLEVESHNASSVTVRFSVNDNKLFSWTGNPRSIAENRNLLLPDRRCIGLVAHNSALRINNVRLRGNSGSLLNYVPWYGGRRPHDTVSWNGHYYKLFDFPVTCDIAHDFCRQMDGYLARVESSSEQACVERIIGDLPTRCWIDGSDAEFEGDWVFRNGKRLTYFLKVTS